MSDFYGRTYKRLKVASAQGPQTTFDYQLLKTYIDLLGSNIIFFLPMLEQDPAITVLENIDHGPRSHHFATTAAFDNDPAHRGLMLAQRYNGTDEGLISADHADYTFGNGAADSVFSVGCWFNALSSAVDLEQFISKYDGAVATNLEWEFGLDTAGKVNFICHDDSVPASIGRRYDTAITDNTWYFVVGTYDATEASTGVDIYLATATASSISAVDDTFVQAGAYTAMEDKGAAVTIGYAEDDGAGAGDFFEGSLWGPFLVAEEMTSTKITNLFNQGKKLLGF